LSFFEEGDEPRTAIESPPPTRRASRRSSGGRRPPADERTVLARRAGAIAIAVVVLAILFFGIRAYLASANTQALKNYNANVTTLISGEQTGVEQPFFASLNGAPGTTGLALTALQSAIYQDYVTANQDAQTAASWSVPSALAGAQRDLLLVLDLRAEAIDKVSQQIESVLDTGSTVAIKNIAGAMNMINASDVIYGVRVQPLIQQALVSDGVQVAGIGAGGVSLGGVEVIPSAFLPNPSWIVAGYVQGKLVGSTSPTLGGSIGAGTHGHKILGVMAGDTQLVAGAQGNSVPYTNGLAYTVQFENDGENDEFGVITKLQISSASTSTLTAEFETPKTVPGQTYDPTLTFTSAPPLNTTLRLTATVEPVIGEKDTTNNTLSFYVTFTGS